MDIILRQISFYRSITELLGGILGGHTLLAEFCLGSVASVSGFMAVVYIQLLGVCGFTRVISLALGPEGIEWLWWVYCFNCLRGFKKIKISPERSEVRVSREWSGNVTLPTFCATRKHT